MISVEKKLIRAMRLGDSSCRQMEEIQGYHLTKVTPKREWIENIVSDCKKYDIPIFMKSSLADIWGEPLIQEFPKQLRR